MQWFSDLSRVCLVNLRIRMHVRIIMWHYNVNGSIHASIIWHIKTEKQMNNVGHICAMHHLYMKSWFVISREIIASVIEHADTRCSCSIQQWLIGSAQEEEMVLGVTNDLNQYWANNNQKTIWVGAFAAFVSCAEWQLTHFSPLPLVTQILHDAQRAVM